MQHCEHTKRQYLRIKLTMLSRNLMENRLAKAYFNAVINTLIKTMLLSCGLEFNEHKFI